VTREVIKLGYKSCSYSLHLFALKDGFEFRLDDGSSSFWFSNWSIDGKLATKVPFVDIHDLHLQVKDVYVDGN
jgi:hypothetical protein